MSWNFASSWNTASSRLFKKLRSQMKQWNLTACSAHWSAAEKWISFIKSEHPDALWILQRKSSASFSYLLMKRVLVMCFEHEASIQDEGSYPTSATYLFTCKIHIAATMFPYSPHLLLCICWRLRIDSGQLWRVHRWMSWKELTHHGHNSNLFQNALKMKCFDWAL